MVRNPFIQHGSDPERGVDWKWWERHNSPAEGFSLIKSRITGNVIVQAPEMISGANEK
jgi:hypothetical protein